MTLRSLALVSLPLLTACAPHEEASPLADAGPPQSGQVRQPVTLSAGISDATTWDWSLVVVPVDSTLSPDSLQEADSPWPTLLPDSEGIFVLELVACDDAGLCDWDRTTVSVGAQGRAAVADAELHWGLDDLDPLDFRPGLISKGGTWSAKWGSGARPPWVRPAVKPRP